mmetsp:Transcript_23888/g.66396  ORF Transcript_23888/g.66396 Transcript_23888/m.66396 type:complete len:230 (-) Transcript_23888:157-846(-)
MFNAGFRAPRDLVGDGFVLRPLDASAAESDLACVSDPKTQQALDRAFGPSLAFDWNAPYGLEESIQEMSTHIAEYNQGLLYTLGVFAAAGTKTAQLGENEAFTAPAEPAEPVTNAVPAEDGAVTLTQLGCVYIFPSTKQGYDAAVYMWVVGSEQESGLEVRVQQAVDRWLHSDAWPCEKAAFPGTAPAWEEWEALPWRSDGPITKINPETGERITFEPEEFIAAFVNMA